MGALFFEGMNYDINSACRLRPKSLNHDVGGTFFNFDRSRISALIESFLNAIQTLVINIVFKRIFYKT